MHKFPPNSISRFVLMILCSLPCSVLGDEPVTADADVTESLNQAQVHFLDALKWLGEAGRQSYNHQLPEFREKTQETLQDANKLLQEWQGLLQKEIEKHNKRQEAPRKDSGAIQDIPSI